jgi:hypothetical protein
VAGTCFTGAAFTMGEFAMFTGNVVAVGAISLGASATLDGTCYTGMAFSLGASAVYSGGVVASSSEHEPVQAPNMVPRLSINRLLLKIQELWSLEDLNMVTNYNASAPLPGLYDFNAATTFGDIVFGGLATDVWTFRVRGASVLSGNIVLKGGVKPSNIRWLATGAFSIAASIQTYGTVLTSAAIALGASANHSGHLYSTAGAVAVVEQLRSQKKISWQNAIKKLNTMFV